MIFFQSRTATKATGLLALFALILSIALPARHAAAFGEFSVGEEKEMGEKLLSIVRKEFKLLDDPDIVQYINRLGREILDNVGSQYFDYHFFVVKNKEFNAFAAPSGLIFLHSAIFETLDAEDELVSVLAHECAHVTSRHIAERIAQMTKVNIGTAALAIAGLAVGAGQLSEALLTGAMAAGASAGLHFSRQNEEEADRLAFGWMESMHRDTKAMSSVIEKMRRISQYRRGNLPPYLLTHPEPERRLGYVQDLIHIKGAKSFSPRDDFTFERIRHRILNASRDAASMKTRYRKTLKGDKDDIMAHYGLSQAFLQSGEHDKAEEELRLVMAKHPDKAVLKTDLALIHQARGEMEKALELLRESLKDEPECLYTAFNLGRVLQQMNRPSEALAQYEKLLPALEDCSKIFYHIGQVKAATNQEGEAYYFLGMHQWLEGQPDAAKRHLGNAITLLPADNPYREKSQRLVDKINRLEKLG